MSPPSRLLKSNSKTLNNFDKLALENFREYLRIPSVHPNAQYDECVSFIKRQAESLGLPIRLFYCYPNKPILIITWIGEEPNLPSILLNGHMDVAPVFEDEWTHDPFAAEIDKNGNIYARGAQDMKSVSIQYLEAIRRLKKDNITLRRTIHISFMPDEEIGGLEGMKEFVKSQAFKDLNVGFGLDEGGARLSDVFALFYGEKTRWIMRVHCSGQPGHGSFLLNNTAGEKARKILDRFYEFREQEKKKLNDDPSLTVGDITSINLTIAEGGVQSNVIPLEFIFTIDCRIAVTVDLDEFEKTLKKWCDEAGEGVWIEFTQKRPYVPSTKLDENNLYWMAFKQAVDNMNLQLNPSIFTGATDSRYVRAEGIPSLGFAPMNNTPTLAHDHDEYLNMDVFLRGIEIYRNVIIAVANVKENLEKCSLYLK